MSERLDRIERALESLPKYRAEFREQYQFLVAAQAHTQKGLEDLRKGIGELHGQTGPSSA